MTSQITSLNCTFFMYIRISTSLGPPHQSLYAFIYWALNLYACPLTILKKLMFCLLCLLQVFAQVSLPFNFSLIWGVCSFWFECRQAYQSFPLWFPLSLENLSPIRASDKYSPVSILFNSFLVDYFCSQGVSHQLLSQAFPYSGLLYSSSLPIPYAAIILRGTETIPLK